MEVAPAFNAAMLALGWSYSQQVDLDALSADRSGKARDAERYRWLRKVGGYLAYATDEGYDAAIDAAMDRSALGREG